VLPLLLYALAAQTPSGGGGALESRLREIIASSGAEVSVAYRTLDGRSEVLIDPDRSFHAASTMKVPVMIELFAQASEGRLSLADTLAVRNEFRSIVDGSLYRLSEGDDSDREVHAALGRTLTLQALCELMIRRSSNFATNLLVDRLGVERIQATVVRLGADGMRVMRGVEDGKAFEKGLNNSTTARALLTLFEKLARKEAVDPQSDAIMLEILKGQQFTEGIPAGVPPGTTVAHKTGNITRIHHDAGIVYGPRPYVLVLLVRGMEDRKASGAIIAELSRTVYGSASRLETPAP
jgi:beta-lactamase class A